MNDAFYLASISHLLNDEYTRVLKNAGISEHDWQLLTGDKLWSPKDRIRVTTILDTVIYATTEMASLPKVDISAEMAAAHIASTVSPLNWTICASWLSGLTPAFDLATAEQSIQIERVSAGKMLALTQTARAALSNNNEWNKYRSKINHRLTQQRPKAV